MQLTVDIPEPVYRDLETQAQREHKSLEEVLIARAAAYLGENPTSLREPISGESETPYRVTFPIILSDRPGSMKIPEGGFNQVAFMSDDEFEDFARRECLDSPDTPDASA